jgi:ADP-dependent phosphofructokinase/glucokinase
VEINSISALAKEDPEDLLEKMNEVNEREEITKRPPRIENVEDWVEKAKSKTS